MNIFRYAEVLLKVEMEHGNCSKPINGYIPRAGTKSIWRDKGRAGLTNGEEGVEMVRVTSRNTNCSPQCNTVRFKIILTHLKFILRPNMGLRNTKI